jgi:hypothetical protein
MNFFELAFSLKRSKFFGIPERKNNIPIVGAVDIAIQE